MSSSGYKSQNKAEQRNLIILKSIIGTTMIASVSFASLPANAANKFTDWVANNILNIEN